ncbi:MAG: hypothetical protein M3125_04990 [Gemmatimonadota bacterium]|nr:hypothetical protein [Gemmatimonadota bacterium]
MRRSFLLRPDTTVHQLQVVISRLEAALSHRGALVRRTNSGEVSFEMPRPWRLAPIGWLALISKGSATLSAWGGGPWRVSYRLQFGALRLVTALLMLVIVAVGWGGPRLSLLMVVATLWLIGYGSLYYLASRRFRRVLADIAAETAERRTRPRVTPSEARVASQHPE